ncbi:TIGR02450 family Trp-rich protein [Ferrovum sp. PN-J185]|uniref:TIGR02450 family Trp-rich protein n=1 Tax=Ferrovum sp. PN-J185 TaxID=1356306 RepID=UPI00079C421D|nr:TIGR02450 family Trp-rich protein [Ferrovum sp. PN-J185]KXW55338.1 hypothetical protein FV185_15840 [Ferrovum sp. PN-J185]MCC6068492.1 TIGR02450 family Trp-rich protein [Ferrovum sp. PN-J185]MDE1892532.1 TIGR02450 family Trp-rich protein [Betaproteobacteria bacterium]MDE2056879.1 TIGR02450 family Trp-rich protein [Betaproteobacteria bacterium]
MANNINSKKLLLSKWTAVYPTNKEKHHMVIQVIYIDKDHLIPDKIVMEALINHRQWQMDWQELKNTDNWLPGWR